MESYNIKVYRGDTWNGIPSISIIRNNAPLVLPEGTNIYMQIKLDPESSKSFLTLDTIDGGITITDGAHGKFRINPVKVEIPADLYFYDLQVTTPTDIVKTYLRGSFTVIQDVTRINS